MSDRIEENKRAFVPDCSSKLFADCDFGRPGSNIRKVLEQGELNLQEHIPRWIGIDPGARTHFYPSDILPKFLIPGRD